MLYFKFTLCCSYFRQILTFFVLKIFNFFILNRVFHFNIFHNCSFAFFKQSFFLIYHIFDTFLQIFTSFVRYFLTYATVIFFYSSVILGIFKFFLDIFCACQLHFFQNFYIFETLFPYFFIHFHVFLFFS